MANVFELFGKIVVDSGDAQKEISNTGEKVRAFASTMKNSITTAAKWGAGIAAAATAATAVIATKIKSLVGDTAEYADTVDKMSKNMKISTQAYQEWSYVMGRSGYSMDKLMSGIDPMRKFLQDVNDGVPEAIKAFGDLGFSAYDLQGDLMGEEEALRKIIFALADMEDKARQSAIADMAFGGAYEEMGGLFAEGSQGIQNLIDKAHELGLVMSEEDVAAGVQYSDAVYDLSSAFDSLKNEFALTIMPYLNGVIQLLIEKIPIIKEKLEEWTPAIENAVGKITEGLTKLIDNPEVITEKLTNIYNGFLNLCAAVKYMKDGFETIWGYVQEIIDFLSPSAGNDAVAEWAKNNYGTNPEKPPLKEYTPGNAVGASTSAAASIFAATDSAEVIEESLTDAAEALEVAAETLSETEVIPDMAESAENNLQEDLNDMDLTVSVEPVLSGSGFFSSFAGGSYFRERASGYLGEIPGHAEGLDYVPYDNYVARLHKGEKVLTANEASAFRSGEGNTRVEAAVNRLGEILHQVLSAIKEGQVIQLETGVLIGQTAGAMNNQLGVLAARSGRRN